jgi:hypothetical protein
LRYSASAEDLCVKAPSWTRQDPLAAGARAGGAAGLVATFTGGFGVSVAGFAAGLDATFGGGLVPGAGFSAAFCSAISTARRRVSRGMTWSI